MMIENTDRIIDYFCGTEGSYIKKCARLAYKDVCRTLSYEFDKYDKQKHGTKKAYEEVCDGQKKKYKEDICELIEKEINEININKKPYNEWHKKICENVIKESKKYEFLNEDLRYGQAQKWVNMTFKNMIMFEIEKEKVNSILEFLHVPIDSYIIDYARQEFNIPRPENTWSNLKDEEYIEYQGSLRKAIEDCDTKKRHPIIWEIEVWSKLRDKK